MCQSGGCSWIQAIGREAVSKMQPHYQLVFDLSQKSFRWWFPSIGILFVLLGVILIWYGKHARWRRIYLVFPWVIVVFSATWSTIAYVALHGSYVRAQYAYRSGRYSIIEGQVENFRAMPYEGHSEECFTIRSHSFCYSDYVMMPGFNQTSSHGGPIKQNLKVRLAYIGNTILRLEIERPLPN